MIDQSPMSTKPELSIITVNYNGWKDTVVLINSLLSNLKIDYELIVVDNGSTYNEAIDLQKRYPSLKAIRSELNLGFAGGNNLGFSQASGDYIFFLNNDTYVRDDTLSCLIKAMKKDKLLGGISPKIIFDDPEGCIQFAGYTPLSRVTLRNHIIGYMEKDVGQFELPLPTPYLHGAAMLIRREAIEKTGMMPEMYFLYYEEMDWSLQIRRAGYKLEYNPLATVYHMESSSTGKRSPLKTFYMTRNRLLFAQRNLHGYIRILSICYQLLIVAPIKIFQTLLEGQVASAKAVIGGCVSFFTSHFN